MIGGPIGTYLIERKVRGPLPGRPAQDRLENLAERQVPTPVASSPRARPCWPSRLVSHRAFLVVPLIGAFFIDFANALLITFFLNLWR